MSTETATAADSTATATQVATNTQATTQTASTATQSTTQAQPNTGATATTGSFRDFIGDDGKFKAGWSKAFEVPEALEKKFTEPKALVGSYVNLEKMISAKGIIPPGPNATADERQAYFRQLGTPEKPEDYGMDKLPKLGEREVPAAFWPKEQAAEAAKLFQEIGITKEQAAKLSEFDAKRVFSAMDALEQNTQRATASLKGEWGAEYDNNLKLAQNAARQIGGDALINDPTLANHAGFIKALAKVGGMIGEKPTAGIRSSQGAVTNPDAEIRAIMADKNNAWHPEHARTNPAGHAEAVKHMANLFKMKHGEA